MLSSARRPLTALPLVLASVWACGGSEAVVPVTSPNPPSPNLQTALVYIENQMSTCGIPGGSIAVVQNGKMTDHAGFGVKDPATGEAMTPSTLFQVGGLSRVALDAAILSMVEKGELELSRPITGYVPLSLAHGFDPGTVSLSELMLDTAGLPDLDPYELSCAVGQGGLAAWFQSDNAEPLWTPPGAVWDFSRRGQAVAGWALETASSQAFEDAVGSRVFGPAGMTTATYEPSVVISGDHAIGHDFDSNGQSTAMPPGTYDCEALRPGVGVYASAIDYAHLAETLLAGGGSMLSAASVAMIETGQIPDYLFPGDEYGYGLYTHLGYKGLDLRRFSGSVNGYGASLVLVPSEKLAVVVMFNAEYPPTVNGCSATDAAEYAASTYLGLDGVAGPNWTTPSSTWTPLTGTYFDPFELGTIVVKLDGGTLTATTTKYGQTVLTQSSATSFIGTFGSKTETVTFVPEAGTLAGWFVTRIGVGHRQS
jgi:CubicO group peptidase (beta-lactamase class C family)